MTPLSVDFDKLNEQAVRATLQQLAVSLQAEIPTLSLRQGVIHDYVLYPAAILHTVFRDAIEQVWLAGGVDTLTSVDPALVDRVAANFFVKRMEGETANGTITIILSSPALTVIPAGALFTAQGKTFRTNQAFMATNNSSLIATTTDRLITQISGGLYAFTIEVTAVEPGEASRLRKDTVVVPSFNIPHFVRAYSSDFLGGYPEETTEMLIARMRQAPAAKALTSATHMRAWLSAQPEFARVIASSVVGAGDAEMRRDRHAIFPGSLGGKIDWYVKPAALPQMVELVKTATLVAVENDGFGVWQTSFGRDEAPAFYEITTIRPEEPGVYSGSFPVVSLLYDKDMAKLPGSDFLPDVETAEEARFTRFQTATVQFKDSLTPTIALTPGVSTKKYKITVAMPPQIAAIQDAVLDAGSRLPAADCLIKAAIPCKISFSCTLNLSPVQTAPDISTLVSAATSAVNLLGFPGRVSVASVVANILRHVPAPGYIDEAALLAEILSPDGTTHRWAATDTLVVPDWPSTGVSAKTVSFYLDPADVTIKIRRVSSLST